MLKQRNDARAGRTPLAGEVLEVLVGHATRFDQEGRWQACVAPPLASSEDRHRLTALMLRSQA